MSLCKLRWYNIAHFCNEKCFKLSLLDLSKFIDLICVEFATTHSCLRIRWRPLEKQRQKQDGVAAIFRSALGIMFRFVPTFCELLTQ